MPPSSSSTLRMTEKSLTQVLHDPPYEIYFLVQCSSGLSTFLDPQGIQESSMPGSSWIGFSRVDFTELRARCTSSGGHSARADWVEDRSCAD
jgi:hypothetical protein